MSYLTLLKRNNFIRFKASRLFDSQTCDELKFKNDQIVKEL